MFFKQLLQSSTFRLALIALVLCGVTLVVGHSSQQVKAQALEPSSANDDWFCTVTQVGGNDHGVFVFCKEPYNGIQVVGIPYTERQRASLLASAAMTAQATNRKLRLGYYSEDHRVELPACDITNCRKAYWFYATDTPAN